MASSKGPEPMDANTPEEKFGTPQELYERNCWAIDVLIEEVSALFKTEHETSHPQRFGACLVVVFTPDLVEQEDFVDVLSSALEDDERVEYVTQDKSAKSVTVKMWDHPITMDTRDRFGLDDAMMGLDRQITPDDLTEIASEIARGDEGFTEGSL